MGVTVELNISTEETPASERSELERKIGFKYNSRGLKAIRENEFEEKALFEEKAIKNNFGKLITILTAGTSAGFAAGAAYGAITEDVAQELSKSVGTLVGLVSSFGIAGMYVEKKINKAQEDLASQIRQEDYDFNGVYHSFSPLLSDESFLNNKDIKNLNEIHIDALALDYVFSNIEDGDFDKAKKVMMRFGEEYEGDVAEVVNNLPVETKEKVYDDSRLSELLTLSEEDIEEIATNKVARMFQDENIFSLTEVDEFIKANIAKVHLPDIYITLAEKGTNNELIEANSSINEKTLAHNQLSLIELAKDKTSLIDNEADKKLALSEIGSLYDKLSDFDEEKLQITDFKYVSSVAKSKAITCYENAGDMDKLNKLAIKYMEQGDPERAGRAIEITKDERTGLTMGNFYIKKNMLKASEAVFNATKSKELGENLGHAYHDKGNYAKAIEVWNSSGQEMEIRNFVLDDMRAKGEVNQAFQVLEKVGRYDLIKTELLPEYKRAGNDDMVRKIHLMTQS